MFVLIALLQNPGNADFLKFLGDLIAQNGTLGITSWAVTAALIAFWTDYLHNPDPSNDAKRWLAIGIPLGLVVFAYFGGILLGGWSFTLDSLESAVKVLIAEIGGSKVAFTATKAVQNIVSRRVRRIGV